MIEIFKNLLLSFIVNFVIVFSEVNFIGILVWVVIGLVIKFSSRFLKILIKLFGGCKLVFVGKFKNKVFGKMMLIIIVEKVVSNIFIVYIMMMGCRFVLWFILKFVIEVRIKINISIGVIDFNVLINKLFSRFK